MMLAMLVGHAGDVENDAGDVDGRREYVHFARKCCKLQHFCSQDGKHTKSQNKTKQNPKLNLDPFRNQGLPLRALSEETHLFIQAYSLGAHILDGPGFWHIGIAESQNN